MVSYNNIYNTITYISIKTMLHSIYLCSTCLILRIWEKRLDLLWYNKGNDRRGKKMSTKSGNPYIHPIFIHIHLNGIGHSGLERGWRVSGWRGRHNCWSMDNGGPAEYQEITTSDKWCPFRSIPLKRFEKHRYHWLYSLKNIAISYHHSYHLEKHVMKKPLLQGRPCERCSDGTWPVARVTLWM